MGDGTWVDVASDTVIGGGDGGGGGGDGDGRQRRVLALVLRLTLSGDGTFVQLPWDKRVARVFCTLFRNREEVDNPGGALTSDCRGNLRRIHNDF